MKGRIKYIIVIILAFFVIFSIYIILNSKNNIQEEQKTYFVLDKILLYTSAMAFQSENANVSDLQVDIYQYTDFAMYINNIENKEIKRVYIDNIKILQEPNVGDINIYRKKLEDFARPQKQEELTKELEFETEQDIPIILSYANKIKQDYVLASTNEKIEYDETILKRAKIVSEELKSQIMFDINIIDSEDNKYKCEVNVIIPIEELVNGENIIEKNEKIKFKGEENINGK